MDLHGYKFLIFINAIFVIGAVPSFYNETYDGYTLIMPLKDGDPRSPLTLPSSIAEQWCSLIGATLPRITDESDQKNIVQFVESAVRKHNRDRMQTVFVNSINHTVDNWTWANGQTNQGFTVRQVSQGDKADEYSFGYLWTGDYRISESRPIERRRYICETSANLSNSSNCEITLDNRCYWKKDDSLTWYKARNACLHAGGDLASFEKLNEKVLKFVLKDLGLTESKSYWVGIYKGVWRWSDNRIDDSEIKYSNWKHNHPSNYNAKCLCLDKQDNVYYWIECECNKEYPFICKRNDSELKYSDWKHDHPSNYSAKCLYPDKRPKGYEWIECKCDKEYPFICKETSSESPLPIDPMPNTSVVPETTARILTTQQMPITSVISETTALSLPVDQMPHTSVISETVRLALVLSSCALIVVIVIFAIAAFIIRKQRNRPMRSSRYETSEAATNEFPIYNEIEEPRENKSSANCSASSPSYATVKRSNSVILVENSLYGDLDL